MFKVDVFVKTLDDEWLISSLSSTNIEEIEIIADSVQADLYTQLLRYDIKDYRIMVYDESKYTNAE